MSDHEPRDDQPLGADLRASFERTRVPAAPPSLRARASALATGSEADVEHRSRPILVLVAAATVVTALIGTAAFVGSRTSPELVPSASPSLPATTPPGPSGPAFTPPGTMALFVDGQVTSGDGWRILGGAPNLPGPPYSEPKIELYVGAGVVKPIQFLGLPEEGGAIDPTQEVIAVADVLVGDGATNPGCGRIQFDGVTFDASSHLVTLRYENPPAVPVAAGATPLSCRQSSVFARLVIALSVDHLPTPPFSVTLVSGSTEIARSTGRNGPPAPTPSNMTVVDAAGTFPKGGLWVRQGLTLWTSSDGARTWQDVLSPVDPIDVAVIGPSTIRIVSAGPGSVWPYEGQGQLDVLKLVLSATDDGGRTWQTTPLDGNFGGLQPVLRFTSPRHGYLLAAHDRGGPETRLLETSDGGVGWKALAGRQEANPSAGVPADLGSIFVVATDGSLWAGSQGDAGPVARPILDVSRDGGSTWADARLPGLVGDVFATDSLVAPPAFFGDDGVVAVSIIGDATRVFTTADAGRTWSLAEDRLVPPDSAGSFVAATRSDWYLWAAGVLTATHDAGRTWQNLADSGLPGFVDWLGFAAPADPFAGIALVDVGSGTQVNAVYVTRDGGASWSPLSLP